MLEASFDGDAEELMILVEQGGDPEVNKPQALNLAPCILNPTPYTLTPKP